MAASDVYSDVITQHYDGGYYSPVVRAAWDVIKDRSLEEKQRVYQQYFHFTWTLAQALTHSERYDLEDESFDLSDEGLGVIDVAINEGVMSPRNSGVAEAVDIPDIPYQTIQTQVRSFQPEEGTRVVVRGPDSVRPGEIRVFSVEHLLRDMGFAMPRYKPWADEISVHPDRWNEPLFGFSDGQFRYMQPGETLSEEQRADELDSELLRLFDRLETLVEVNNAINPTASLVLRTLLFYYEDYFADSARVDDQLSEPQ